MLLWSCMNLLELTCDSPAENLALDELLLETAERDQGASTSLVLRVWESPQPVVVLGRSSPWAEEVNHDYCTRHRIPVLRRVSGGATVVAGPGCLMYAVVLSYNHYPELRMLDEAHRFVMDKQLQAVQSLGFHVEMAGTCDLVWQGRKFSGNSLRCLRHVFLYHGTFLYNFDLDLLAACLGNPSRQPAYRQNRRHRDFVTNLPVDRQQLVRSLQTVWAAQVLPQAMTALNSEQAAVRELAANKYASEAWTKQR